ncbi:AAA family ATPase [Vibrio vulnificus]|uniref:AAA family ATPase n=1 Tax=Vibrio vulnificus TaxID=672 RepID=UPI001594225D|nr:AAA family ATPase [Vibrio vulnificus]EID4388070.1 AAA family ATPase [Vibrio vulnificus]NVC73123.1 ATP-binding protein [Vibrio vulnificus]
MANKVTSIGFKNYKSFKGEHNLDLENLTLLYGYNNSGKSALIRLIKLIADSASPRGKQYYLKSVFNYESESIRGGVFENLVSYGEVNLSISVNWGNSHLSTNIQQEGFEDELISRLTVCEDGSISSYTKSSEDSHRLESIENPGELIGYNQLRFDNHDHINGLLDTLSRSTHWISPTRKQPPREFDIGLGTKLKIHHDGEGVAEMLWYLSESESPSFIEVNDWLKASCGRILNTDYSSILKSSRGRKRVSLVTVPAGDSDDSQSLKVSVVDSGEGIAQALPIVTLCAMAANGELGGSPILVIEQPELHLHPRATVELAKFIVNCIAKNSNAIILLETHSESFMRAIQIAMVDSDLNNSKVNAYWVSKKQDGGSKLNKIIFDEQAFMSGDIPQNLFRENIDFSRELSMKRRNV